ncbi:hypothetical protein SAMN04488051_101542 [Alkalimonas amylolytica]|uniref:Uncharacterized protein n=2 Tax=Alkalimonas amylolytica TaxID=152573 RepID=A0A1H3Y4V9_ALKAM|nr:hypothetical protein SAMN04488051_101542 [Alkalimonas amylolytica]
MKTLGLLLACMVTLNVTESIHAPIPSQLCSQQDSMFAGASIIYSECQDDIDAIVVHGIQSSHSFEALLQFAQSYQNEQVALDEAITDPLFDGLVVALTPFDPAMSISHDEVSTIEFSLSDKAVFFIRETGRWQVITVLPANSSQY